MLDDPLRPLNTKEKAALWIAAFLAALLLSVTIADAKPTIWKRTQASYYTLYGNRTSCGITMSSRAWHVASLGSQYASCGKRVTLCHRYKCVHVRVMDRGAYHPGRQWDLTPRVRDALRCSDLCNVRWTSGWVH